MKKLFFLFAIMTLFLATACAKDSGLSLPSFSTQDLDGQKIGNEIFSKAQVTVLNIWGTFCPPCIGEMPELGEWAKNMPKGAQLVGLVVDVPVGNKAGVRKAKEILSAASADFTNILADQSLASFLRNFQFVPTTILVDQNGKVIGQPIVGAQVGKYKSAVKKFLDEK